MEMRLWYIIVSITISVVSFVLVLMLMGMDLAVQLGFVLALIPAITYLCLREKKLSCTPEVLMNEAPTVIGMVSTALVSNGSFDYAIRDISENGPKNISVLFKRVVMNADCRVVSDITSGIRDFLSSLPKEASPFRRAMDIMINAFESSDKEERKGMMRDAESIVLAGLKQIGETYSSKLSSPCMLIFGLGVMVPMIMISILPMLTISGNFAGMIFDSGTVSLITLVFVPVVVAVVIISMREKNPFLTSSDEKNEFIYAVPLVLAVPLFLYQIKVGSETDIAIIRSAVSVGILSLVLLIPKMVKERNRIKMDEMLKDSLFDLGNRLMMSENFETSLKKSFAARTDCEKLFESVSREMTLSRGDIEKGLHRVLDPISSRMARVYCDIYRSSVRDNRDAGRFAVSVAHQLQDQNGVIKSIENKLKSMLDMMTGTSAVFAPVILGMSIVMLDPLSQIAGITELEDVSIILAVYLIELSVLIAALSSNLMCRGGMTDTICRFNVMMSISLMVFSLCSSITL
ncbi:MAG: hypothetical protein WC067_01625 [Candidatus Methanomethylophilaceae archaeon]